MCVCVCMCIPVADSTTATTATAATTTTTLTLAQLKQHFEWQLQYLKRVLGVADLQSLVHICGSSLVRLVVWKLGSVSDAASAQALVALKLVAHFSTTTTTTTATATTEDASAADDDDVTQEQKQVNVCS